jgi:hypothetical protein
VRFHTVGDESLDACPWRGIRELLMIRYESLARMARKYSGYCFPFAVR